jgi:hypothetical protein
MVTASDSQVAALSRGHFGYFSGTRPLTVQAVAA